MNKTDINIEACNISIAKIGKTKLNTTQYKQIRYTYNLDLEDHLDILQSKELTVLGYVNATTALSNMERQMYRIRSQGDKELLCIYKKDLLRINTRVLNIRSMDWLIEEKDKYDAGELQKEAAKEWEENNSALYTKIQTENKCIMAILTNIGMDTLTHIYL